MNRPHNLVSKTNFQLTITVTHLTHFIKPVPNFFIEAKVAQQQQQKQQQHQIRISLQKNLFASTHITWGQSYYIF